MKKIILAGIIAVFAPAAAFAAGYGAAGCGLGSVVFEGQKGFVQVFAATTNATFGSQTFGISSGTSNCGGGGTSPTAEQYIEANKVALATDMSKGNGETLKGLAEIMSCNNTTAFNQAMQKNYKTIYPTEKTDTTVIYSSIRTVIKKTPTLANTCKSS